MLQVVGVQKSFGDAPVLRGVDLELAQHDVVALIGASGSGKSTLLKTINLLEPVDDGQIFLAGDDITEPRVDVDEVRAQIGVVFQHYNLFPHRTVLDNVTLASRLVLKVPRAEAEARGLSLLERIGLSEHAALLPRPSLRGTAAARGHRPRDRHRPQAAPPRRDHQRARPGARR